MDFIWNTEQPVFNMKGHLVASVFQTNDKGSGQWRFQGGGHGPPIFAWPPVWPPGFFLNLLFKFIWLT